VSPEDPRHGSNAGVMAHRNADVPLCELCKAAQRRTRKVYRLRELTQGPARVRLGEEAARKVELIPVNHLAAVSGVHASKITHYRRYGPDTLVYPATRDAILNAQPAYTVVGLQRRLRALSRIGWTMPAVAKATGVDVDALKKLRNAPDGSRVCVRQAVADGIVAAYDSMSMTPAPAGNTATTAVRRAAAEGWVSPLAWDDIDDADERPDGASCATPGCTRTRSGGGRLCRSHQEGRDATRTWAMAELVSEWEHLRSCGVSEATALVQLDTTLEAVQRAYSRAATSSTDQERTAS